MIEDEKFIRESNWSCALKSGSLLIKRFKYYVPQAAHREAMASEAALLNGINTPRFLRTNDDGIVLENVYEYHCFSSILDPMIIVENDGLLCQLIRLIQLLNNVNWRCTDTYWKNFLIGEFSDAMSYVQEDCRCYIAYINKLIPECFIHGDFTIQNLGLENGGLIVYDFQHGALGPKGWDKAYFASTIHPKFISHMHLIAEECMMAEVIAAIRLGRSIRKKSNDISERNELFQLWKRWNQ